AAHAECIAPCGGGAIATTAPTPARVRLRDVPVIFGGAPLTVTRLTVDSLFGDAVDGHLFTSDLHCGGTAEVVLDVTDPDDAIRGLLALVVRDLATVAFDTLGADAGSGQGRLTALRARLTTHTGDDEPAHTVDLREALSDPHGGDAETVRSWVAALRAHLAPTDRGKGEERTANHRHPPGCPFANSPPTRSTRCSPRSSSTGPAANCWTPERKGCPVPPGPHSGCWPNSVTDASPVPARAPVGAAPIGRLPTCPPHP